MTKVLILYGGLSAEREVSLRSGKAVAAALEDIYEIELVDPTKELSSYIDKFRLADVVFPCLHGKHGEDGEIQKFLESIKVPFVGCDSGSSRLCFDKYAFFESLGPKGILFPKTKLVDYAGYQESELSSRPFVLKPNDEGSSIDTFIVRDPSAVDKESIKSAYLRHEKMILQELIDGIELTVAVIGDTSLPVIEIIPPENKEFDYENKYNGATRELCPPEHIGEEAQIRARKLAEQLHKLAGCRDLSRSDMIMTESNELYVLETNTIPGLTDQSLVPKAAQVSGLSMAQLCDMLVKLALNRT
jgi:D-alanine-D-alanine ligase